MGNNDTIPSCKFGLVLCTTQYDHELMLCVNKYTQVSTNFDYSKGSPLKNKYYKVKNYWKPHHLMPNKKTG